jgi:hypothetical protein
MIEKEKLQELLKDALMRLDYSQNLNALNYWCKQCDEMVDRNHALRHRINDTLAALAEQDEALAESRLSDGPLSKQLRPDVECAPWVIGAVKKLEGERDEARAALDDAYRRGAEAMREAVIRAFYKDNDIDYISYRLPIPEDK